MTAHAGQSLPYTQALLHHFIVTVPFQALQSMRTVAFEYSRVKTSLPAAVSVHSPAAPTAGSP